MAKKKIHQHVKEKVASLDERMKKYRFYKEIVKDALLMLPLIGSFGGGAMRALYGMFVSYTEKSIAVARSAGRSIESAAGGLASASAPTQQESSLFLSALELGWFLCIVALIVVLCWRAWKLILRLVKKIKNGTPQD